MYFATLYGLTGHLQVRLASALALLLARVMLTRSSLSFVWGWGGVGVVRYDVCLVGGVHIFFYVGEWGHVDMLASSDSRFT